MSSGADKLRGSGTRRRISRHQAQENLRAHAVSDSAEAPKEKIDRGKIPDAETNGNAGEIALTEEKERRESDSIRDTISECVCIREEAKIFSQPFSGIFPEPLGQEKETQDPNDSDSIPG